MKKALPLGEKG